MDIHRDNVLKKRGYKIIRVYWPDFKKLNESEKNIFLNNLKKSLLNADIHDFIKENKKFIKENTSICPVCGKEIGFKSKKKYCSKECLAKGLSMIRKKQEKNYKLSSEHRKNISVAHKGMMLGCKNINYGHVWVYNENLKISKSVQKDELNLFLSKGFKKGRKIKFD